ncbi:hypothetical protein KU306_15045 [Haloferax larsenii]|uniref:Uncharacterized protein n=1 Tax=Haloferax larsenii TaxID=302484 RepID=A0ABY5RDE9_HALLR|nr:hypothetical protein [Haloferax larsenii]ELZ78529.1 hypothetical protein C455_12618 [Haloferax larsenii JCM 13917]UVE50199.1 hypothetical protein KU306_15045 [Haloferax larsenii]
MSSVPLNSEETVAIFADQFTKSLGGLDATEQRRVLKKIRRVLESDTPSRHVYEIPTGCDTLEIFREGNILRIYGKLVLGVPKDNKEYNILHLFYVDKHKYRQRDLVRFDELAERALKQATVISSLQRIEEYLTSNKALDAGDVQQLLDEGNSLS